MVFGDGENDLSMFEVADESYAPANAQAAVKSKATEIIGHHDDDGVARFLRERFSLGAPLAQTGPPRTLLSPRGSFQIRRHLLSFDHLTLDGAVPMHTQTLTSCFALAMAAQTVFGLNVRASEEQMHEIVAAVSADRIQASIETLVGFGTRHTLSETQSEVRGIGAARRWIEAEFNRISDGCGGCLEVFTVSGVVSGTDRIPDPVEIVNVVAILRGTEDGNRFAIMSGDIDTRVSDPMNAESDSPGANDNGSGMAGVIEAARVLSQYRFPGSIAFVGLSGEEQGLNGGAILAQHAIDAGWNIDAVVNNDMIGNITGVNGVTNNTTARVFSEGTRYVETESEARQRRFQGGEVDSASRNIARYVDEMADRYIPNLDIMMIYRLDRFGRGGHHRPFNEAGFPAVRSHGDQ